MNNTVIFEVFNNLLFDIVVVVAVVKGARTAEKVDIFFAVLGIDDGVFCFGEYCGEITAV